MSVVVFRRLWKFCSPDFLVFTIGLLFGNSSSRSALLLKVSRRLHLSLPFQKHFQLLLLRLLAAELLPAQLDRTLLRDYRPFVLLV